MSANMCRVSYNKDTNISCISRISLFFDHLMGLYLEKKNISFDFINTFIGFYSIEWSLKTSHKLFSNKVIEIQ